MKRGGIDISFARRRALLRYLGRKNCKDFIRYADDMPDYGDMWIVLKDVLPEILTDFLVESAKSGYFEKLCRINGVKLIDLLRSLKKDDLIRVLLVISDEECLLIIRNLQRLSGGR